jgi:hypothetical protein
MTPQREADTSPRTEGLIENRGGITHAQESGHETGHQVHGQEAQE